MSSQYLPFEILEKGKKNPTPSLAQLQVREVKMYEIVCPKESEDKVMAMLKPDVIGYGFCKFWNKPIRLISRILGLKKPSTNWKPNILPLNGGLSLMCFGTKDDKMGWKKKMDANQCLMDGDTPKEFL